MRAVLFSVRPKWCAMIATGEKDIEVRKAAPKLPTPYKGYMYCTKGKTLYRSQYDGEIRLYHARADHAFEHHTVFNGKVWAEFICDADLPLMFECSDPTALVTHYEVPGTCLSDVEIMAYLGNGVEGHGLHISELIIYDRPREISDFKKAGACQYLTKDGCKYPYHCFRAGQTERCGDYLDRPPQSWCYVEDIT